MRAIQFQQFGEPEDVLALDEIEPGAPGAGEIRVAVHAVGLNPADWALVGGLFADAFGPLPRGYGFDVSGVVDAVGEDVSGVAEGDRVFGAAALDRPSAGAADLAVLTHWSPVPDGLDLLHAATLTMAAETAWRGLDELGVKGGQTLLVHGAGGAVGEAAVRLARRRGAHVIATAGANRAPALTELGAAVTSYGDGMVDRVRSLAGSPIDRALDASPVGGSLPDLVALTGDPDRVLTLSDFEAAQKLGVRISFGTDTEQRFDVLPEVAQLAADGEFALPIAETFALEQFAQAAELSRSGRAGGKVLLLVAPDAVAAAGEGDG